jgi:hypothetical protein
MLTAGEWSDGGEGSVFVRIAKNVSSQSIQQRF